MKYFFRYGIIVLAFLLTSFIFEDEVINAIKNGNATELSKYLDNTVDISLPDKNNTYSKSQAELVLKDFFKNNTVKNFPIMQKGENAGSEYIIGTLQTSNGDFHTTIFLKAKGNKELLQELRFEK